MNTTNEDMGGITAELESTAKPWWQSMTVLALIATLILNALKTLNLLPPEVTHEKIVGFLVIAAPVIVALWGRLRATTLITSKPLQPEITDSLEAQPLLSVSQAQTPLLSLIIIIILTAGITTGLVILIA